MSKKKEDLKLQLNGNTSLAKLLLDAPSKRYPIIALAVEWAYVLKKKQENLHLRKNEILEKALGDVLAEKITTASIEKEKKALEKQAELAAEEKTEAAKIALKLKTNDDDEEESPKKKTEVKKD